MKYIKDFYHVSKKTLGKTIESFKKNYLLIFVGIVYSVITVFANSFIGIIASGPFAIISGILIYLVQSAIISSYLYFLFNVITYNSFSTNDLKDGVTYYIWKIYGVLFIFYLGRILLGLLANLLGANGFILVNIVQIAVLILLNPLGETIYQKGYPAPDTIMYTFEFIKDNWFNWLISAGIFVGLIYLVTGQLLTGLFNVNIDFHFVASPSYIIRYLVGQTLFTFMMIYRGHLYKLLSTSSIRKRMFMSKF